MGGTRHIVHFAIVTRSLVFIMHQQADRRAESQTILNTGENRDLVRFLAWCGQIALSRSTPVELSLDIGFGEL